MEHASHDSAVPAPTDLLAGRLRGVCRSIGTAKLGAVREFRRQRLQQRAACEGMWLNWGVVLIWVGSRSWLTEPLRGSLCWPQSLVPWWYASKAI